ncbi:MAG: sulfotransferase [Woeseiaceae bacterium]
MINAGQLISTLPARSIDRVSFAIGRLSAFASYVCGPKNFAHASAPVFIGGTGGSGTRVVASLVEHAGYFIGTNLHRSLDSLDLDRFCDTWLLRHLAAAGGTMASKNQAAMDRGLERALIWHRSAIPSADSPWALKHPRTVLMLPYLEARHPGMRFVHVIRDGRDMAFAPNTRQSDLYSDVVVPNSGVGLDSAEKLMRFWAHSNLKTKEFADMSLATRYRRIRLEDLCAEPEAEIRGLFAWLGVDDKRAEAARAIVRRPNSIGRWRTESDSLVERITTIGAEALDAFGYR